MPHINAMIVGLVLAVAIIFLGICYKKFIDSQDNLFYKTRELKDTNSKLVKTLKDYDDMYSRVKELEGGIEQHLKIKIRNDITKVVCDFDIIELSIMLDSLPLIIERDYQMVNYIKRVVSLIEKIQNVIPQMKKGD
jgi:hypothetical protein